MENTQPPPAAPKPRGGAPSITPEPKPDMQDNLKNFLANKKLPIFLTIGGVILFLMLINAISSNTNAVVMDATTYQNKAYFVFKESGDIMYCKTDGPVESRLICGPAGRF